MVVHNQKESHKPSAKWILILWPFKAQWLLYALPNSAFRNYSFCPQNKVTCCVRFYEQTAIISPYSINWLVFITEECASCEVRTEFSPGEICGGQSGDGTSLCPSTSVLPLSFLLPILHTSVSPTFFPRRPPLASKNNHGSSHPCSQKYTVSGWYVPKSKYLYIRKGFG